MHQQVLLDTTIATITITITITIFFFTISCICSTIIH